MSNIKPLPGIITKTEIFEGEKVEIGKGIMLWKCTVCGKIYTRLQDAEYCCDGT